MEISWTDRVKNEKVLQRVKEESNRQQTVKDGGLTVLVTPWVGTAFQNTSLK
jgi:hypothetical protein